jgi:hypothetical protein
MTPNLVNDATVLYQDRNRRNYESSSHVTCSKGLTCLGGPQEIVVGLVNVYKTLLLSASLACSYACEEHRPYICGIVLYIRIVIPVLRARRQQSGEMIKM